ARRSGALITSEHANDLGRDVLAVPGPVDSPTSRGANALLRDGAGVVVDPDDPAAFLPWLERADPESAHAPPEPGPELGGDALTLWTSLERRPVTLTELGRRSELPPPRVLAALSLLEIEGWAVLHPGMTYARRG
ncbi:MAG TPA: DNA-processing protein DprA, partial [Longimicrobiales bacterium]|nr:DNA-processing protein DprA [Longimicrobiales bacterium]